MTTTELQLPLKRSFPELIDNTCRSAFRKCEKYWYYQNILRIKPAEPSIHLHAGGAFAKGLEIARRSYYEQGMSSEDAIAQGVIAATSFWGDFPEYEHSNKSLSRTLAAIPYYFSVWKLEEDFIRPYVSGTGPHGIEFSFALPIEDENGNYILHPDTGNPVLYGGRFDMLAVVDSDTLPGAGRGTIFVEDEKTTSQLGDSWRKQWNLDSQFTGYCWAARSYGLPVAGAIIRGISFLKNGNGNAEAIVFRPEWQIARWHKELVRDVKRMIELYRQGDDDVSMALDKSICQNYGGCSYSILCESPNPDNWIPLHFVENTWNPMDKEG